MIAYKQQLGYAYFFLFSFSFLKPLWCKVVEPPPPYTVWFLFCLSTNPTLKQSTSLDIIITTFSFFSTQNHIYIALVILRRTIKVIQIYYCVNMYKLCHSMFINQCSKRLLLIRTPTTSVRSQLLSLMPSYSSSLPTSSTNKQPPHKLYFYDLHYFIFLLFMMEGASVFGVQVSSETCLLSIHLWSTQTDRHKHTNEQSLFSLSLDSKYWTELQIICEQVKNSVKQLLDAMWWEGCKRPTF